MPSISVDFDVELYEFSTEDIVDEVCDRIKMSYNRKALTDKQKTALIDTFEQLGKALSIQIDRDIEIKSLDDKLKYEHLVNIFNKYSTSYIQSQLPE